MSIPAMEMPFVCERLKSLGPTRMYEKPTITRVLVDDLHQIRQSFSFVPPTTRDGGLLVCHSQSWWQGGNRTFVAI
jgi:hypothetical protein